MASLAKLLISVGADTVGFETDMKRLQRDQKKRFDQMTRDAQTLAKGFGVAFAAAATAMTAIVKKTVDVADHMRDLSQQTGISTDVLSGYAYAAEQSGSSLEALTGGIRKMQRSIVDASSGMAEQQRAFERLGLSANELLKLSPDKAFELIADRLSKMENATLKAATAQERTSTARTSFTCPAGGWGGEFGAAARGAAGGSSSGGTKASAAGMPAI